MDWYWSWILSAVGLLGFFLAGSKVWWAWYVNIANQVIWTVYSIVTEQWGFLVGTAFYFVVFIRNAVKWTKEHQAEKLFTEYSPEKDPLSGVPDSFWISSDARRVAYFDRDLSLKHPRIKLDSNWYWYRTVEDALMLRTPRREEMKDYQFVNGIFEVVFDEGTGPLLLQKIKNKPQILLKGE